MRDLAPKLSALLLPSQDPRCEPTRFILCVTVFWDYNSAHHRGSHKTHRLQDMLHVPGAVLTNIIIGAHDECCKRQVCGPTVS